MRKNELLSVIVTAAIGVVIIMVLLEPFGLDRVGRYKYPIMIGYGILSGVAVFIGEMLTTYLLRMKPSQMNIKRALVVNIVVSLIMGFFVSAYAAIVYSGNIRYAFYTHDGQFTFRALLTNTMYALIISFFLFIYFFFKERNRILAARLKEEMELNRALARKSLQKENEKSDDGSKSDTSIEQKITLKGNTKESLDLLPSLLLFAEAEGNYVNIFYIENGASQRKTLRCTLKQVEDSLAQYPNIIRCHRAFIVNVSMVSHVDGNAQGYRLHLKDTDRTVLVSRAYASSIYDIIER